TITQCPYAIITQWHNKSSKFTKISTTPLHSPSPVTARQCIVQHRRHDVVAGGLFAPACTDLLAEGGVISWEGRGQVQGPGKGKTEGKAGVRTTYTCPHCGLNAWAKADVGLRCGACEVALEPEGA